jgi:signal transduction histidine kinase
MRRRLVAAFVGLTVVSIVLYGIPRAFILADMVRSSHREQVELGADLTAALVSERVAGAGTVDAALLSGTVDAGERVAYAAGGSEVVVPTGTELEDDDLVATRSTPDGGTLTYSVSGDTVDAAVARAVWPLLVLGLVMIALAAVAGWLLARRLARPFAALASAAGRIGAGPPELDRSYHDMPEAEAIARALRESSARVEELVLRERQVAVDASHQLRTPVTALRLALEDLARWPETPPAVVVEVNRLVDEVDRLSKAVTGLLEEPRQRLHASAAFDLAALVEAELASGWPEPRPHLRRGPGAPVAVRLPRPEVREAVRELLALAWRADQPPRAVDVTAAATYAQVVVTLVDGSWSAEQEDRWRGMVERSRAVGARLIRREGPPTRLVLMLPLLPTPGENGAT